MVFELKWVDFGARGAGERSEIAAVCPRATGLPPLRGKCATQRNYDYDAPSTPRRGDPLWSHRVEGGRGTVPFRWAKGDAERSERRGMPGDDAGNPKQPSPPYPPHHPNQNNKIPKTICISEHL